MSTLIVEYEPGTGQHRGASTTAVNLLLDEELLAFVSLAEGHTLVGELQTLELIELLRYWGQPGDLIAIDIPSDRVERVARRLDAMVFAGQLQ